MQEYKRQIDRESRWLSTGSNGSPNGDGIQAIGRSSHKMIEAVMQSAAKGKVKMIQYVDDLKIVILICIIFCRPFFIPSRLVHKAHCTISIL